MKKQLTQTIRRTTATPQWTLRVSRSRFSGSSSEAFRQEMERRYSKPLDMSWYDQVPLAPHGWRQQATERKTE